MIGYVQSIKEDSKVKYLEVLWMYSSEQTTCAKMKYPYPSELFASDHCNCGPNSFRLGDVTGKIAVRWSPQSIPTTSYFVRQIYCGEDSSFRTFRPHGLVCKCHQPKPSALDLARKQFTPGDTLLMAKGNETDQRLEPVILVGFGDKLVRCRQLLRAAKQIQDGVCAPNEVLWTDKIIELPPGLLGRKCNIRFLLPAENLPSIYDRRGQADCFFITRRLISNSTSDFIMDLELPFPSPMNPGFDPDVKPDRTPLATMSLFFGGGNIDRGLVEGGATDTKWAVEWDLEATLTYKSNCRDRTAIFFGEVNESLARAIEGRFSDCVPTIGEVDILCSYLAPSVSQMANML